MVGLGVLFIYLIIPFVPGAFKYVGKNIPHLNEEGSIAWFNDDLQKQAVEWNEYLLRNINENNLE